MDTALDRINAARRALARLERGELTDAEGYAVVLEIDRIYEEVKPETPAEKEAMQLLICASEGPWIAEHVPIQARLAFANACKI